MPLTKQEKEEVLKELKEKIDKQKSIVFVDFTGLKVKDLSNLRKLMRKDDCELKVAKKTLVSLALKEKGGEADVKELRGEIALGFGYADEVSPFKIIGNFSKGKENIKILGGLLAGKFYDKSQALALAQLPSRPEIIAQLFSAARYSIFGIFNTFQRSLSILKVKG